MTSSGINWQEPDIDSDQHREDLAFAADDLGVDADDLYDALVDGSLVPLTPAMWKRIDNTDSLDVDSYEALVKSHKAKRKVKDRDEEMRKIGDRFSDVTRGEVRAPIVVKRKGGSLYLVSGNTRLGLYWLIKLDGVQVWLADTSSLT